MRKLFAALLLAVAVSAETSAQLLYRISGNGLEKPSYLIGTFHVASATFAEQIDGVKEAITATDQVYGELSMDVTSNPDSLKAMTAAMMLPDGKTLKDILSASDYKKLDATLVKLMGVGLSNKQVMEQMGRMCPAALTTNLSLMMYLMKHPGEFDPTNSFDNYFQLQAKANNEPYGGLETMSSQTRLLFSSPLARQTELLMCLIDNADFYMQQQEAMSKAFYDQNLDALAAAMDKKIGGHCDATPDEETSLICARNAEWARIMPEIMKSKPTFFAVGAGHLPGVKGLLAMLRAKGYKVEPVTGGNTD